MKLTSSEMNSEGSFFKILWQKERISKKSVLFMYNLIIFDPQVCPRVLMNDSLHSDKVHDSTLS